MNATSALALTGVLVWFGRELKGGKGVTAEIVVAYGIIVIVVLAMADANEQLGSRVAVLILLAAAIAYVPRIAKSLGYGEK